MIFVVLGTQKFQFNRMLKEIDEGIKHQEIKEPVFAQIGNSDYLPKHFAYERFLDTTTFHEQIEACDVLLTHSGVGTIMEGLKLGKKIIVYPRLTKYKEHVDNHQIEIAHSFMVRRLVLMCRENDRLTDILKEIRSIELDAYVSSNSNIIKTISAYIDRCKKEEDS